MPNYKLTTNLIADCMALIPQNLERLNQKGYIIERTGNDICFDKPEWNEYFFFDEFSGIHKKLEYFDFVSHCLSTIPEFQDEIKIKEIEGWEVIEDIADMENEPEAQIVNGVWYRPAFGCDSLEVALTSVPNYPTIASATLHGQGENPPSTLEELCESYKNVMTK